MRRRAAAAPGRGVKVPGIILVHDPRWGPERKQGGFLPRPRRGRAVCCALAGPPAPPRAGLLAPGLSPNRGRQGGGDTREVIPRSPRTALRFCSASSAEPAVHRVPPSKKSARPSVPPLRAPFRPRAQPELRRDPRAGSKMGNAKKTRSPAGVAWQLWGTPSPISQGAKKAKKKSCRLGETSVSSF